MIEIDFDPHPGQEKIWNERKRFNVVACGRRFGKTTFGAYLATIPAAKGQPVGWFAPTYRLLEEAYSELRQTVAPLLSASTSNPPRLEFKGGGVIDFWTLQDPSTVARGRKYRRVIIDEAAMVRYLEGAWTESIRPALTDLKGDAWFFSTPKGRNYFYTLFLKGQAASADWASWQMPTSVNTKIKGLEAEVKAAQGDLPESAFSQEYLAQFIENATQVFRNVYELCKLRPESAKPNRHYVIGVDWGKRNDFTVFSVWDAQNKNEVYLERFNQIDYDIQAARLEAVSKHYQPKVIIAEANAMGEPIIDSLKKLGLPIRPFWTTNQSKRIIIEDMALAMQKKEVYFLDDPVARDELIAYELDISPGGLNTYSAPAGMHDDTVMSRALAIAGLKTPTQRPRTAPASGTI